MSEQGCSNVILEPGLRLQYPSSIDKPIELWPELGEEHYRLVSDGLKEFAMKNGLFSIADFEGHLDTWQHYNVGLPPDDEDWQQLFDEMRDDILGRLNEGEEQPLYTWWLEETDDGTIKYGLAEYHRAQPVVVEPGVIRPTPPPQSPSHRRGPSPAPATRDTSPKVQTSPVHAEAVVAPLDGRLVRIFSSSSRSTIRRGKLLKELAQMIPDLETRQKLIAQEVGREVLYASKQDGNLVYTIQPPLETPGKKNGQQGNGEEDQSKGRPLNRVESKLAQAVIDAVARSKAHVGRGRTGRTITELLQQLQGTEGLHGDALEESLRKIFRALQRVGLVEQTNSSKSHGGPRTPRILIEREVRRRWLSGDKEEYLSRIGQAIIF
ncbi:MAG TPA: hypothetical protein VGS08_00530 [Candidatus Saccharimonadales bacterium]|nr:hypothetical protein [Candidatus Saccharimonadales bacterium]